MNKATDQLSQILKTAKVSFETLKSSEFVKNLPHSADETVKASLKKLGLVGREEHDALEARVAQLEAQLAQKTARKKAAAESAPADDSGAH